MGLFYSVNWTLHIDETLPVINSITPSTTAGNQVFSFSFVINETNKANCSYTINNGLTNTSISSCTSPVSGVTLPALATDYNLTLFTTDLANNKDSYTTIVNIPISGGVIQTGGGGGTPVIIGTGNWTMATDTGTNKYTIELAQGESRTKEIIFINYNTYPINLTLTCEGNLCIYVNLSKTSISLPIGKDIPTSVFFTINLPENVSISSDVFNIIAKDQLNNKNILTISLSSGVASEVIKLLSKVGKNTSIFNIVFPNILLIFIPSMLLAVILNFTAYKKLKTKAGFTFLTFIVGFILITILLP
jgi:hypothetical protein